MAEESSEAGMTVWSNSGAKGEICSRVRDSIMAFTLDVAAKTSRLQELESNGEDDLSSSAVSSTSHQQQN